MRTPELPPESMYWTAFNETDALAIIMQAQNYINSELLRKFICLMDYECRYKRSLATQRAAFYVC